MTTRQLTELITLVVKKAIKEELAPIKQVLIEMNKRKPVNGNPVVQSSKPSLTEIQKKFRKENPIQQRRRQVNFSSDPMLNSLLNSTEPLKEERTSYLDQFENDEDIVNVPITEDGRPIKAPTSVLNAMNRDYSDLVNYGKSSNNEEKNKLRSNMMAIMEGNEPSFNDLLDEDESLKDLDQY